MKRLGLAFAFCALLWFGGADAQVGLPWPGPGATTAGLALDGHINGTNSTGTVAVSLTTNNGSGNIVVAINTIAASVTSVTASGLTFTSRGGVTSGAGVWIETFTAPYSTNFSGNITAVVPTAVETTVTAFGVSAATGFDSGGPQSSAAFSTNVSETTANAKDFIWFNGSNAAGGVNAGAPWTNVHGSSLGGVGQIVGYQIVSATGTYTSAFSSGNPFGVIIDAVK